MDFKLKKNNLNFKVYTAAATPATGTENDIVIITSTAMKNWVLSPNAPSGAPRTDGDVWLQYSVDGDVFNTVKQNSFMIAPLTAWQYIDGTWASVPAVSYHGGEWTSWLVWLFNTGNQHTNITGGWSGAATINSDGEIVFSSSGADTNGMSTDNKINKNNAKELHVNVSYFARGNSGRFNVVLTKVKDSTATTDVLSANEFTDPGELVIDLSNITEAFYVYLYSYSTATVNVDKIWMI